MSTTETTTIDWAAADKVAQQLGAHTRALVARGDAEEVIAWAREMSRQSIGEANYPRGSSYMKLAVLLGHKVPVEPEPDLDEECSGLEEGDVVDD
jgi:hypothetical protein